jgi:hypothetical protein
MQKAPKNNLGGDPPDQSADSGGARPPSEKIEPGDQKIDSNEPEFSQSSDEENITAEILPRTKKTVPARKDKGGLHVGRHGILAASPFEALVKAGENPRLLRRLEKALRSQLGPHGALQLLLFDRAFASLLRGLLAARVESQILGEGILPADFAERARRNKAMAQATGNVRATDPPDNLLERLSVIQRYDAYNWNEFRRALDMLLLLRNSHLAGAPQTLAAFQQDPKIARAKSER